MGVVVFCRVSGLIGVLSRDYEQMMSLMLATSSVLTPVEGSLLRMDRPLIVLIAPINGVLDTFLHIQYTSVLETTCGVKI
jgi:hypothetical protein